MYNNYLTFDQCIASLQWHPTFELKCIFSANIEGITNYYMVVNISYSGNQKISILDPVTLLSV